MAHAHSPVASSFPQAYQSRGLQQQPPTAFQPQQRYQQSNYYDVRQQPIAHNASPVSPQSYAPQLQQSSPFHSSGLHNSPAHQSPVTHRTSIFAQYPTTPTAPSPQSQFPPNSAYHAFTQGLQSPASAPPMQHSSPFSQHPHSPSTRRPLPTPSGLPRPVTQPPPSRRPLPEPNASPSAPNTPFRHRPSASVSVNQSPSALPTRCVQSGP